MLNKDIQAWSKNPWKVFVHLGIFINWQCIKAPLPLPRRYSIVLGISKFLWHITYFNVDFSFFFSISLCLPVSISLSLSLSLTLSLSINFISWQYFSLPLFLCYIWLFVFFSLPFLFLCLYLSYFPSFSLIHYVYSAPPLPSHLSLFLFLLTFYLFLSLVSSALSFYEVSLSPLNFLAILTIKVPSLYNTTHISLSPW